jgi:putative acetyltransferase
MVDCSCWSGDGSTVIIRREASGEASQIRAVTAAAFARAAHRAPPVEADGAPGEATLVTWLRADEAWIPEFSLVAIEDDVLVGHVIATRADLGGRPVLGLGPVSVAPDRQRSGVGSALMHAVLGAAEARGEPIVCLLGDPAYYRRFGFVPAHMVGVIAPDPSWGEYFQARVLASYNGEVGRFRYAAPFDRL